MGALNQIPALAGGKLGNVTSAGWQVTLCDPIWHTSSHTSEAKLLLTAIFHYHFTLLYIPVPQCFNSVGRQEGHLACKKTEWRGAGVVICLERGADLHMAKLMPQPLTVSCFSKIQIGFAFLVPGHPGSPGQRDVKQVCVCVCVCAYDCS